MDVEARRETTGKSATLDETNHAAFLREFIEQNAHELLQTIRVYVWKAGLGEGVAAAELSLEVVSEVCVEALEHAERYDPARSPGPWLLGIAANLIKRRRDKNKERAKHEADAATLARLADVDADQVADDGLFDWFVRQAGEDVADTVLAKEEVERILSLVSEKDREILTLAVLKDLDGDRIAKKLGIKSGAVRVRLFRALSRLRVAMKDAGMTVEGIKR